MEGKGLLASSDRSGEVFLGEVTFQRDLKKKKEVNRLSKEANFQECKGQQKKAHW